jgi:septal ring factor EnvC (AmiA/AmiB activator)
MYACLLFTASAVVPQLLVVPAFAMAAKRSRSVDLDLEAERITRRRLQEELGDQRTRAAKLVFKKDTELSKKDTELAKKDAEIAGLRVELERQQKRADEAQLRASAAARRIAAADARAAVSEQRAIAAIQEAEARTAAAGPSTGAAADPDEDQPKCPVCLDKIYDENVWILSCGHITHKTCKENLVRERLLRCPLCRERVL